MYLIALWPLHIQPHNSKLYLLMQFPNKIVSATILVILGINKAFME